jgi:hypothetical protein
VKVGEDFEIRPTAWVGSFRTGADLAGFDNQCLGQYKPFHAVYPKNGTFSRETNRYGTFTGAASVSVGGTTVSVNARSGLSRWVKVNWKFGTAGSKHYLCGNDGFPPVASRIFAGA